MVAGPPAAGRPTSSPVAHATQTRSVILSQAAPRGAGQTLRRAITVPAPGLMVTRAPPDRSATCTRPAPSSTSLPGSSPAFNATVWVTAARETSTTYTESPSGSAATAVFPSCRTSNVPPEMAGGVVAAVTLGPNEGGAPASHKLAGPKPKHPPAPRRGGAQKGDSPPTAPTGTGTPPPPRMFGA